MCTSKYCYIRCLRVTCMLIKKKKNWSHTSPGLNFIFPHAVIVKPCAAQCHREDWEIAGKSNGKDGQVCSSLPSNYWNCMNPSFFERFFLLKFMIRFFLIKPGQWEEPAYFARALNYFQMSYLHVKLSPNELSWMKLGYVKYYRAVSCLWQYTQE